MDDDQDSASQKMAGNPAEIPPQDTLYRPYFIRVVRGSVPDRFRSQNSPSEGRAVASKTTSAENQSEKACCFTRRTKHI